MRGRDDFAGVWQVRRRITDRRAGQGGQFTGQAVLTPDGPTGVLYAETGQVQIGAGPMMLATRRYRWQFDGPRVTVQFDDGRPFHHFTASGLAAGTDHLCGADMYRGRYDFTGWPDWTATWAVSGPRKDYGLHSQYWRLANT